MILLDTNVISEPMKPAPSPRVIDWLNQQQIETLFLPTPVLAELLAGVAILPGGRRKTAIFDAISNLIDTLIGPRVLAFDRRAAEAFATATGLARKHGKPPGFADGQIAAIASVHGLTVATRDTMPFLAMGVPVINPWDETL